MTFQEMFDAISAAAAKAPEQEAVVWSINPETYRFWKANAGNAKARRRWRRREIPNSQRVLATGSTADVVRWAMGKP